jgi:predicted metal-dependent hydrolase
VKRQLASEVPVRQIDLGGEAVAYRLIRSRRRTIGLEIAYGGAVVRAPYWVRLGDIQSFLRENGDWIRGKLASWRAARAEVRPEEWRDRGLVRFEGQELRLSVFASRRRMAQSDLFDLRIGIPSPTPERIQEAVEDWLRERAAESFPPRVARYCAALALPVPQVRLSNAATQWGSCEHHPKKSVIRLHWRLVQLPPELADYIIAHEVSHLREMNHGKSFWALVATLYPDYRVAEKRLRDMAPLIEAELETRN